jgi:hypothetical protein
MEIEITSEMIRAAKALNLRREDVENEIRKRIDRYGKGLIRSAKRVLTENKTISQLE